MKKQVTILLSFAFLFFALQGSAFAQKSSSGEKKAEEELKKKEQMEKQKAMSEKNRVEELYRAKMIDASTRRAELEAINEAIAIDIPEFGTGYRVAYPQGTYSFFSDSQDSETLEFRKTVKESTFSKEVPFTVESSSQKVSIAISGACKTGEIRIKILMPGGKLYTEVLLDEFGSVNWNKSFSIDEEDNSKSGAWKFSIAAKDATGNFRLSIKTN